jgi:hypothetical protein
VESDRGVESFARHSASKVGHGRVTARGTKNVEHLWRNLKPEVRNQRRIRYYDGSVASSTRYFRMFLHCAARCVTDVMAIDSLSISLGAAIAL